MGKNDLLVHARSHGVELWIHGPRAAWDGQSGEDVTFQATSKHHDGVQLAILDGQRVGPIFTEDTTYRLRARSIGTRQPPVLRSRKSALTADVDVYDTDASISGNINFRRQVGLCDLVVGNDLDEIEFTLEVWPTKLDYKRDFEALLADISSCCRSLAMTYYSSTYRFGGRAPTAGSSHVEWLTRLRNELEDIKHSFAEVARNPHRHLVNLDAEVKIERVQNVSRRLIKSLNAGAGRGTDQHLPGVGAVRERVIGSGRVDSIDNNENRYIKSRLLLAEARLAQVIKRQLESRWGLAPGGQAVLKELQDMAEGLRHLLSTPMLTLLGESVTWQSPSLAMLQKPGYSQLFASLVRLDLGLTVAAGEVALSVKDVHELYEIWCFITVVSLLAELFDLDDLGESLVIESSGLNVRLSAGRASTIRLTKGSRLVSVSYNKSYGGDTGTQKPDIVISIQDGESRPLILLLDAKYRLDNSSEYLKTYGCEGPPIDSVNALHRYRDAILARDQTGVRYRPVVVGAALFPSSTPTSTFEIHSRLWRSLGTVGIGAIPLLPSSTSLLRRWLTESVFASWRDPGDFRQPPSLAPS